MALSGSNWATEILGLLDHPASPHAPYRETAAYSLATQDTAQMARLRRVGTGKGN